MRTHVDVDTGVGLRAVENVREAVRRTGGLITMEQVAFPQRGLMRRPGTRELLEEALKAGVEVIGGLDPAGFDNDPVSQLDAVFGLAEKYQAKVDIHLHDRGTLGAWQFDLIIERTAALGLQGRVTISHGYALAGADDTRRQQLIERLAEHRIGLTTTAPGSGTPPLRAMSAAGASVGAGNDGVRDLWSPYGSGDMLERAMVLARRTGRTDDDVALALRAATYGGAELMGLDGYGLAAGDRADLVAARGRNVAEAVASVPERALVVKSGRITVRAGELVASA
jgi:cytosine deaminase